MSKTDIERFVADLKSSPDLLGEVQQNAGGLSSVVELAKNKGYDVTLDEAKSYIRDRAQQTLSDDQLDAIAGGKGHHHHSAANVTQAVNVQTAVNVTTAANVEAVAEATTAATTAEVAAEAVAVVVLT